METRDRSQDPELNSGNSGGSEVPKRMSAGIVMTYCSSPFRATSQLMRKCCSEKVGVLVDSLLCSNRTNVSVMLKTKIFCVMMIMMSLYKFHGFLVELVFNTVGTCMSPANFKRPIVILGPLNDIAMEKLARELPDEYELAG